MPPGSACESTSLLKNSRRAEEEMILNEDEIKSTSGALWVLKNSNRARAKK